MDFCLLNNNKNDIINSREKLFRRFFNYFSLLMVNIAMGKVTTRIYFKKLIIHIHLNKHALKVKRIVSVIFH